MEKVIGALWDVKGKNRIVGVIGLGKGKYMRVRVYLNDKKEPTCPDYRVVLLGKGERKK